MSEAVSGDALSVNIDKQGVIHVAGDIDMSGGPVLDSILANHDEAEPLVLDLSNVYFIDSSGLRVLLSASRRAANTSAGSVTLRGVGPEITRILDITGTNEQFRIESTRA